MERARQKLLRKSRGGLPFHPPSLSTDIDGGTGVTSGSGIVYTIGTSFRSKVTLALPKNRPSLHSWHRAMSTSRKGHFP